MKIIDFRVRPPMPGMTNRIFHTNPERRDGFNRKLGFTLRDCEERFLRLPIRPESMRKVLYDNAARILKFPPA